MNSNCCDCPSLSALLQMEGWTWTKIFEWLRKEKRTCHQPENILDGNWPNRYPKPTAAECVLCTAGNNSDCTGNYTPLRKKHLCKGNSFPLPPPAWPRARRAFKTNQVIKIRKGGLKRCRYIPVEGEKLQKFLVLSQES